VYSWRRRSRSGAEPRHGESGDCAATQARGAEFRFTRPSRTRHARSTSLIVLRCSQSRSVPVSLVRKFSKQRAISRARHQRERLEVRLLPIAPCTTTISSETKSTMPDIGGHFHRLSRHLGRVGATTSLLALNSAGSRRGRTGHPRARAPCFWCRPSLKLVACNLQTPIYHKP
jgi:hypothetical protein